MNCPFKCQDVKNSLRIAFTHRHYNQTVNSVFVGVGNQKIEDREADPIIDTFLDIPSRVSHAIYQLESP